MIRMTRSTGTPVALRRASLLLPVTAALLASPVSAQPAADASNHPRLPAYVSPHPPVVRARPQAAAEAQEVAVEWERLPFAVVAETRTSWPSDTGAKRLASDDTIDRGGLGLHGDILRPAPKLVLRVDGAWVRSLRSSFQTDGPLEARVTTQLFLLGASLRYELLRWLAPFARVEAGLGWDKVTVTGMRDRDVFEQASAGAGLLLCGPGMRLWKKRWWTPPVALLGIVEGGYTLGTGSDFTLRPSLPSSSPTPIPASPVALGQVGRSMPYLRIAFGLAF